MTVIWNLSAAQRGAAGGYRGALRGQVRKAGTRKSGNKRRQLATLIANLIRTTL